LITVSAEDTIGVIGPPRAGKTAGILIPQAMMWAGPMISVSVKEDILLATGDQRTTIARPFGGNIHVFDPTDGSKPEIEAMGPHHPSLFVRWSPIAGCEVAETAKLRAEAMVGASFGGEDGATAQRNTHFEHRASMILRTMFHAAAVSDATIGDVLGWIDSQDFMEPASRIRDSESTEKGWVSELLGLAQIAPEERGSSFSTAANAMDAFRLSTVQRNCAATDLDLRSFVQQRSTLYVVAGASMQKAIAPLFSALIESIAFACIDELAREGGGRLEPRLLLQLDEIANIAPLPNLQRLLTLCGGRGVCLSYAGQSWRQLASRYGQDSMRSIWQSTKAQLVFGGVGDAEMLRELEELMGKTKEKKVTRSHKAHLPTGASVSVSKEDEARLHLDQIYSDPDHAFLFYRGDYQHITPAKIFDANLGRPFAAAAGWSPSSDLAGFS
jgi:type IV secretory pathway TraG/TraD family ATPase VirD4